MPIMSNKALLKIRATHEAAHAVMAARVGWEVKQVVLAHGARGYTDMRPRRNKKYSPRADILITLAGHAADLRMAQLHRRHRPSAVDHILSSLIDGRGSSDFSVAFKLLAKTGRADSIVARFERALGRANSMLAEQETWAAVEQVAAMLLRYGRLPAGHLEFLLCNMRPARGRKKASARPRPLTF